MLDPGENLVEDRLVEWLTAWVMLLREVAANSVVFIALYDALPEVIKTVDTPTIWRLFYDIAQKGVINNRVLQKLVNHPSPTGFRLSESLSYTALVDQLAQLSINDREVITSNRWNGAVYYVDNKGGWISSALSTSVVVTLMTSSGHLIHNISTSRHSSKTNWKISRTPLVHSERRVAHVAQGSLDVYLKEQPDAPGMAMASYLLGQRLCGHGAVISQLVGFEVMPNPNHPDHQQIGQGLSYPVLLSPTVPGETLGKILTEDRLKAFPLDLFYLSNIFLLELLKSPGDGFGRNYVLTPTPETQHDPQPQYQIVCVDNEQMAVSSFESHQGQEAAEISIIYALPELRQGMLAQDGLHPDTIRHFANIDIDTLLYDWLVDIRQQDNWYQALVVWLRHSSSDCSSRLAAREQENKHPFLSELRFPEGYVGSVAMNLHIIQGVCRQALADKPNAPRLLPETVMQACRGERYTQLYYKKGLPSEPLALLKHITTRQESSCSRDFVKRCFGGNGLDIKGRGVTPEEAANEIGRYRYDILSTLRQGEEKETVGAYLGKLSSGCYRHIAFSTNASKTVQLRQFRRLITRHYPYTVLSIENATVLDEALFVTLLDYSKASLRMLALRHCNPLTTKLLKYLAKFTQLEVLLLSGNDLQHLGRWGQRIGRSQPLTFPSLRLLSLSNVSELTQVNLQVPRLQHLVLKMAAKLTRLEATGRRNFSQLPSLQCACIKNVPQLKQLTLISDSFFFQQFEGFPKDCLIDIDAPGLEGESVFEWGINQKLWSGLHWLKEYDDCQDEAICQVICKGQLQRLQQLLVCDPSLIEKKNSRYGTALLAAVRFSRLDIVKYLVQEKNANIDARDWAGNNALLVALFYNCVAIAKWLLENISIDIEFKNNTGETALLMAARQGHLDIVTYLIKEKRANINAKNVKGSNVLHAASIGDSLDIVKYLVDEKKFGVEEKNTAGYTAIMLAAENHQLYTVKFLIHTAHAALAEKNINQNSVLELAVTKEHWPIVGYLLCFYRDAFSDEGYRIARQAYLASASESARAYQGSLIENFPALALSSSGNIFFLKNQIISVVQWLDCCKLTAMHPEIKEIRVRDCMMELDSALEVATDRKNHAPHIEVLYWQGHCNVAQLPRLVPIWMNCLPNLTTINLSGNNLTDDVIVYLAPLCCLTTIRTIDLSGNAFGYEGIRELLDSIKKLDNMDNHLHVKRLILGQLYVDEAQYEMLMRLGKEIKSLTINIDRNNVERVPQGEQLIENDSSDHCVAMSSTQFFTQSAIEKDNLERSQLHAKIGKKP